MKGKELFAVIDGIKKPLRQWAEEYDLTYEIVFERCKKSRSTEAHRWNDRQRWVYVR